MGFFHSSSSTNNKPTTESDGRLPAPSQDSKSSEHPQPQPGSSEFQLGAPHAVANSNSMVPANIKDAHSPHTPSTSPQPGANQELTPALTKQHRPGFIQRFSNLVRSHDPKPTSSTNEESKRDDASGAHPEGITSLTTSGRARKDALILQSLILGPQATTASPQVTKSVAKPQLTKIKTQLLKPKSANKLIAALKALPVNPAGTDTSAASQRSGAPIHAVCLEHTDAEEDRLHFCQLVKEESALQIAAVQAPNAANISVANASLEGLTKLFRDMRVVSLITTPDLGIGQPGDGKGLLAGAVPTAETVIKGITQITPQLMALGYATGQAFFPDHTGVHPPTDRMSILTYWWGLELCLPPPSITYLSNAQSISSSIMNFLTAVSLVNNGVREILPFIRYISQFIDFEFNSIKKQDKGKGVVCAATWIMPAAMVPRPWDFPPAPPKPVVPVPGPGDVPDEPSEDSGDVQSLGTIEPAYVPLPANPPNLSDVVIGSPKTSNEGTVAHVPMVIPPPATQATPQVSIATHPPASETTNV